MLYISILYMIFWPVQRGEPMNRRPLRTSGVDVATQASFLCQKIIWSFRFSGVGKQESNFREVAHEVTRCT